MTQPSLILAANGNNGRQAGGMLAYRESLAGGIIPIEFPFTRTTAGMERLSDGLWREAPINMPRRYWDGTKYSYLFEPARTNLFLNSAFSGASFPVANWTNLSGVGTGSIVASTRFNGNAIKIDVSSNFHAVEQTTNYVSGTTYSISIDVEAISGSALPVSDLFRLTGGPTGTFTYFINGLSVLSTANVTVGRVTMVFACTANGTHGCRIGFGTGTNPTLTGSITFSLPQNEVGANATSPIITAGSTVQRTADSATVNVSGLNIGDSGAIYAETSFFDRGVAIRLTSNNNQNQVVFFIVGTNGNVEYSVRSSNIVVATAMGGALNDRIYKKHIIRWTPTEVKIFINGQVLTTLVRSNLFNEAITTLNIGNVTERATVWQNELQMFNYAPTDAECIALTTL